MQSACQLLPLLILVSAAHLDIQNDTHIFDIYKKIQLSKPVGALWLASAQVQRASCCQVALFMVYWSQIHMGGPGKEEEGARREEGEWHFPPPSFSSVCFIFVIII